MLKKRQLKKTFDKSLTNKIILIAEDDQINIEYAKKAIYLFSEKIQVIRAKNGKEAYKLYLKHNPDLIIMDLIMPEVDGYQATKMIRTHNQEIPIIAMTAKALDTDKEFCLSAGMNDFISKPVSLAALKKMLMAYL